MGVGSECKKIHISIYIQKTERKKETKKARKKETKKQRNKERKKAARSANDFLES